MSLILTNSLGQVIRSYNWTKEKIILVQMNRTGRIEATCDTKKLQKQGEAFTVIAQTSLSQLKKSPCSLGKYGELRFAKTTQPAVSPSVYGNEEDPVLFKSTLQKTALAHVLILALLFSISWTHNRFFKVDQKTVKVKPIEVKTFVVKKKKRVRRTVKPRTKTSRKKVVKQRVKSKRRVKPHKRVKVANKPRATKNLSKLGALGALGSLNKQHKGGSGLNLKSINKYSGSGSSKGAQSKGLKSPSLNGRGLIARSAGKGKKVSNSYGYGTKGRAGGQSGYGKHTIGSGKGNYFHPLQEFGIVEGGLEKSQIAAVINRNIGQVIYCYEKGLQKQPKLTGRVAIKFIIGATGKVSTANIASSSLKHRNVEKCITRKLKAWNFPKPRGRVNVKVTYPFILKRIGQG